MNLNIATQTGKTSRKPQLEENNVTIYTLAREELAKNGNNADMAEESLFGRLSDDPALLRALARYAVRQAVNVSVASVLGNQRAKSFASIESVQRAKEGAKALARGIKSALLDMPLADGMRLRDATVIEIAATAERWEKVSSTMAHRARWLRSIEEVLPPGRRCGDILTERKAAEMFRKSA